MADHLDTEASPDWHSADVKAAISKAGSNLARLSKQNGYACNACSKTLVRPWPTVERIIAKFLDVTPMTIWPSRYHPNGRPRIKERPRRLVETGSNYRPPAVASNGKAGGRY